MFSSSTIAVFTFQRGFPQRTLRPVFSVDPASDCKWASVGIPAAPDDEFGQREFGKLA